MAPRIDVNSLVDGSRVFIAEGSSERGLIKVLIESLRIEDANIFNVEGERNLKAALLSIGGKAKAGIKLACLGLVFDANNDYAAKLSSISANLKSAGFDFDATALNGRGIYSGGDLPIGVFLSPGGRQPGRIETMILKEIGSLSIVTCINCIVSCVRNHTGILMDEKARTSSYLCTRNSPVGVGTAFEKKLFDIDNAAYSEIKSMMSELAAA